MYEVPELEEPRSKYKVLIFPAPDSDADGEAVTDRKGSSDAVI